MTVDDEVHRVTVNGVAIDINLLPNRNKFRTLDSINLHLSQGDVIAILGQNNGKYGYWNPGYMNAEILYNDINNVQQRIVTDTTNWKCYEFDKTTMQRVATDSGSVCTYGTNPYGYPSLLDKAEWIWSCDKPLSTVECEVQLGEKPIVEPPKPVDEC